MSIKEKVREDLNDHWSVNALRAAIIIWALSVILLSVFVKNRWLLAGMLAWEVLP